MHLISLLWTTTFVCVREVKITGWEILHHVVDQRKHSLIIMIVLCFSYQNIQHKIMCTIHCICQNIIHCITEKKNNKGENSRKRVEKWHIQSTCTSLLILCSRFMYILYTFFFVYIQIQTVNYTQ